jgi:hypothetical protein
MMKNTYYIFVLFAFLISQSVHSQITLNNTNFANGNETYVYSTSNDLTIDFATTGPSQNWDFSGLTPSGQRADTILPMSAAAPFSQFMFGSFAPPQYKANYFNSSSDLPLDQLTSVLPITINDVFAFTRITPTQITNPGIELKLNGNGIAVRADTIETRYELPLNFGDSYQSRGYLNLDLNPIYDGKWIQYRQRASEVDGWGSVTTPVGTYSALRIHHIINELDSVFVSGFGAGFWVPLSIPTVHEYEWRTTTEKEPVMRIRTSVVLGTEAVTSIEYRDTWLGLSDNHSEFSLIPNPASDLLSIVSIEKMKGLRVVSSNGQIMTTLELNAFTTELTVSNLPAGVYFVVIETVNGTSTKLVVKK